MSLGPTYVRARDGALYKNPVLVFPEGFVCFDETDPPELVIWLDDPAGPPPCNIVEVLGRVLGRAANPDSLGHHSHSLRVVPDTDPWEFGAARAYWFKLDGRIPRPTKHDGTERYPRRCSGAVLDFPAQALDAAELDFPKRD